MEMWFSVMSNISYSTQIVLLRLSLDGAVLICND